MWYNSGMKNIEELINGEKDDSEEAKEKLSYVFKGLGVRATEDADGAGTAWKDSDAGVGTETAPITPSV